MSLVLDIGGVDDPAGTSVDEVRSIRDEIEVRVRGLIDELLQS
jgi:hypothetical protein